MILGEAGREGRGLREGREVCEVGLDRGARRGGDLAAGAFGALRVAPDDADVPAQRRDRLGGRSSEARGRPGHDCHLAVETERLQRRPVEEAPPCVVADPGEAADDARLERPVDEVSPRARASRVQRRLHPERRASPDPIEDALHDRVEQPTDPTERKRRVVVDDRPVLGGLDGDGVPRDESRTLRLEYDPSRCVVVDDLVAERHVTPSEARDEVERGADPDRRLADPAGLAHARVPEAGVGEVGHVGERLGLRKRGLDLRDVAGHLGRQA